MTGNIHKKQDSVISRMGMLCLSAALALAGLGSCERSLIYEYEGDCSTHYLVQFRYDYNMKWADAFGHEVKYVTLYVVDGSGNVVWQKTEEDDALAGDGYAMEVEVDPGEYSLLVWCGTRDNGSFIIPETNVVTDLTCTLDCKRDADEAAYVDGEVDRLYYGRLSDQTFDESAGTHLYTVPLIKDTNTIRVVLQQASGGNVDKDNFTFAITADNGFMDWDNSLIANDGMTYYAFYTAQGEAEFDNEYSDRDYTFSAAVAEFTVARLVEDHDVRLTITNAEKDEVILSIPLIDIVLMVKDFYNQDMSDQEYLDRQDEYSLVFFIDDEGRWVDSYIYINTWRVVLQSAGL